ncbi:MAG: helix-turn-helix domain-containing protein [Lachnospiraceae bacterium]|nr:helix-turn-helix domain-containing protein [Lachnospiraceae bacterium]
MTSLEIIKKLCDEKEMSISTLEKELGYSNGSLSKAKRLPSDRIYEISKYFGVTMEYLMTGINKKESQLNSKDAKEITNMLNDMEQLLKQDGLMFDGNPASPEAIESILSAMQIGMEMAKKKNKEKYTPKKYKKD